MAVLRKLGQLANIFLEDQLKKQNEAYTSNLTKQRQEENYRQNLADKTVAGVGPRYASGEVTPESDPNFDSYDPALQQALRAQSGVAPSKEQRGAAIMGDQTKAISAAKTPEELGSLGGRFEDTMNAMHAKKMPIGLNDVQNLAQSFNGQADVLGNAAATKQEQQVATEKSNHNIDHPPTRPGINVIGMDGGVTNYVLDHSTGKMRLVKPGENTDDVEWKQTNQPTTGNDRPYYTLQPVYDKSGRPAGAVKLEGRTGKLTYVGADQVGGELKGPPGQLGSQEITNETSLDALDNLQTMFDSGAKNLVGPVEGRLRVLGQSIPGVPTNEEFANFDAASSAFKNSVIKAITGAQMSEQEADRILQQVPLTSDKADVWKAKAAQTRKNLKYLDARIKTPRTDMSGGGSANETPEQRGARLLKELGQ